MDEIHMNTAGASDNGQQAHGFDGARDTSGKHLQYPM
jgi:hypothetical protein